MQALVYVQDVKNAWRVTGADAVHTWQAEDLLKSIDPLHSQCVPPTTYAYA
jgi:hypothetical protein